MKYNNEELVTPTIEKRSPTIINSSLAPHSAKDVQLVDGSSLADMHAAKKMKRLSK